MAGFFGHDAFWVTSEGSQTATGKIPVSQGLLTEKNPISSNEPLTKDPRAPPMSDAPHHHHDQGSDEHAGHDEHEGHSPEMFRDRFWLSLILTVPVVFWSAHIQELLGYRAPEFPGSDWIARRSCHGRLSSTAVLSFCKGAWRELKARLPGMMTLISLAITVAFLFSWVVQLGLIRGECALVGIGHAGHDHAPGSLDRDALHRSGPGGTPGAGEAPSGHRDTDHR